MNVNASGLDKCKHIFWTEAQRINHCKVHQSTQNKNQNANHTKVTFAIKNMDSEKTSVNLLYVI